MAVKSICIIGSGASGITAMKQCRDEGFDVTCYEKSDFLGGLWKYRDADVDGLASVMRSTIINSSKEMSAFSDFPPPKEFPNYMHNSMMVKYIEMYAQHAKVTSFVNYKHEVVSVTPAADYDKTGRWNVMVKNLRTNDTSSQIFDGVMVCTGHHVKPLVPTFPGQEKFKGRIIHSHSYKKPDGFNDRTVVAVGVGNSGGDVAVEMSMVAKKVYLSTRRGAWIVHRVGPNGRPFDSAHLTRWLNTLFHLSPYNLTCAVAESQANSRFDHKRYGLKPKHRIFGQHVMVNDALPNRILSGTVVVKADIKKFTETGIVFDGEDAVTPCDDVILSTGYEVSFPFIDESLVPVRNNDVNLYKYAFAPNLKHPHTLAFIGLGQPIGALFPISEIQSRWFALLMAGKLNLPPKKVMENDIAKTKAWMAKRYFPGHRHTLQIDWIDFMDDIGTIIGAKPNLMKYAITDPRLWKALYFGPCLTYQYRLDGPHKWPGAREAILTVFDRIDGALDTRKAPTIGNSPVTGYKSQKNGVGQALLGIMLMAFLAFTLSVVF